MTPRTVQPAGSSYPAPQGTWYEATTAAAAAYAALANAMGSATDLRGGSG